MNRNATPLILIILAIGIFFTFTNSRVDEIKTLQLTNDSYTQAINNSVDLIKARDVVLQDYNKLDVTTKGRLDKMMPDNIDNVRLIIDIKSIAKGRNLNVKNIRTTPVTSDSAAAGGGMKQNGAGYNVMDLSVTASASYSDFLLFLQDLERSLRFLDVSHMTITANDSGSYDYSLDIKTYWLKQ
jgi:Tfp pilus assembly protein PilO